MVQVLDRNEDSGDTIVLLAQRKAILNSIIDTSLDRFLDLRLKVKNAVDLEQLELVLGELVDFHCREQ